MVTDLADKSSPQILLLAPDLLGESLALQLKNFEPSYDFVLKSSELSQNPSLIIWSIEDLELPNSIQLELRHLNKRWNPSPVLILLPSNIRVKSSLLLEFDCPGILQDPDLKTLQQAISTLINGGRVFKLKSPSLVDVNKSGSTIGFGQWLLISGIQQIRQELYSIDTLIQYYKSDNFAYLMLKGRKRELLSAKSLLLWMWGPINSSVATIETKPSSPQYTYDSYGTDITISSPDSSSVWKTIYSRLIKEIDSELANTTGNLLAIDAINPIKKQILFTSLLNQLDYVLTKLRSLNDSGIKNLQVWSEFQTEIQQQAIRAIAGKYVRILKGGESIAVGEQLTRDAETIGTDDELPDSKVMLEPLLFDKPIVIDGQQLEVNHPRALLELENYISNWLIRTGELISSELISICADWPELRTYLLNPKLFRTRELERFRNQLNSQNRWQELITKPIRLYESQRHIYSFQKGSIVDRLVTELRDEELKQLGWWQKQVAFLVEARDALAPQVQALVKRFGDLLVVLLTKVVGRGIGLVGRGIAQGMGRSLSRS